MIKSARKNQHILAAFSLETAVCLAASVKIKKHR